MTNKDYVCKINIKLALDDSIRNINHSSHNSLGKGHSETTLAMSKDASTRRLTSNKVAVSN